MTHSVEPVKDRLERLPTFATIEQEAEFWDTHDSTELEHLFEDVDEDVIVKSVTFVPRVELEPADAKQIARLASQRNTTVSALIRMWVLERLVQERGATPPSPAA